MTEDEQDLRLKLVENLKRFEDIVAKLPGSGDVAGKVGELRRLLAEQRPPRLVLLGRRGSGKSSLINAIFGTAVAEVGHEKAQTGRGTWFTYRAPGGAIDVLDTRGFQEGSAPSEADDATDALASVRNEIESKPPDAILFVVKASEADSAIDHDLDALTTVWKEIDGAHRRKTPIVIVLSHCDEVEPKLTRLHESTEDDPDAAEKRARVKRLERQVEAKVKDRGLLRDQVIACLGVSSYQSFRADGTRRADERWRIPELVEFLFRELPEQARIELARLSQVRALQEEIALRVAHLTAAACAAVGAAPIPVADIVPITSMQMSMVIGIGYIGGRAMTTAAATEFLGAMGLNLGAGLAFREAARQLVKLLPGAGLVLSSIVAYAGTYALGRASIAYFIQKKSAAETEKIYASEKKRSSGEG